MSMEKSILTLTKKMLGIPEEYEHFDMDIITHINSVFSILNQLGIGQDDGFCIEDKTVTWDDYFSNCDVKPEMVKSYLYAKVRLLFDPPQQSAVLESMKANISEFEFRLNVEAEMEN